MRFPVFLPFSPSPAFEPPAAPADSLVSRLSSPPQTRRIIVHRPPSPLPSPSLHHASIDPIPSSFAPPRCGLLGPRAPPDTLTLRSGVVALLRDHSLAFHRQQSRKPNVRPCIVRFHRSITRRSRGSRTPSASRRSQHVVNARRLDRQHRVLPSSTRRLIRASSARSAVPPVNLTTDRRSSIALLTAS